ncbi:hypothetical protein F0562_011508 [Nyssa sinensis]|uniref:DUF4378 domain-containing protein n=1 Tax=Nyssa sinensis TaxID=561372 RepID=A0A5J4ZQ65_9ASTE|nr:hypothetical protein F0562_011508 [Nyssa sinensis]
MERRLPKSPPLCGKSHSGCMWGLIGILDFCRGNSNRKLLSDGKHLNRHDVGPGKARSRLNLLPKFDEKCQGNDDGDKKSLTVDAGERSIKKFIKEEMSTKQLINKQATVTELKHIHSDSGLIRHLAKNHKKSSKICQRAYQFPAQDRRDVISVGHQASSFSSSMETSSDKLNLAAMLEAFCNKIRHENGRQYGNEQRSITCARNDLLNDINLQQTAKAFIDQMFIDNKYLSRDRVSHQSKHLLGVFEILNANKEIFMELLQDPNSLLSRHIEHLQNSPTEKEKTESFPEVKFLECIISNPRNCEEAGCTVKFRKQNMHNFLKKIKSRYGYLSKGRDDPQPPNRIVVLKPGGNGMQNSENVTCNCSSLQLHHNLRSKGRRVNPAYFPFRAFRRKLKYVKRAHRKKQHWMSLDGASHKLPYDHQSLKEGSKGISDKASIGKTVESSTDAKRRDEIGKPRDSESTSSESVCKKLNLSIVSYYNQREIDIYLEAKRHLSERLSEVDGGDTFSSTQAPRTLGRILSLPEHIWATLSPKRDGEHGSVSAQMSFSSSSKAAQNVEVSQCMDNGKPDGCVKILEINDSIQPGDFNLLELACESNSTLVASGKQSIDATNTCEEIRHLKCLRSDSPLDVSSSSPSSIHRVEVLDSISREEHPSPVYVLEPIFTEFASPTSTIPQPAQPPIQPLHPKINLSNCSEDNECVSKYVRAVLQASGLHWDELSTKFHSSDELLDPSLFDEVDLFHFESCCDHKLLFDCINEVLLGVYQRYFRCSPWVSFLEPKIWPLTRGRNLVEGVIKGVNWYLLPPTMPRTLQQIVGKDMAMSGKWIDIRLDSEDIVVEMAEAILEELTMETVMEIQI